MAITLEKTKAAKKKENPHKAPNNKPTNVKYLADLFK
jgi:hypothetical protein